MCFGFIIQEVNILDFPGCAAVCAPKMWKNARKKKQAKSLGCSMMLSLQFLHNPSLLKPVKEEINIHRLQADSLKHSLWNLYNFPKIL